MTTLGFLSRIAFGVLVLAGCAAPSDADATAEAAQAATSANDAEKVLFVAEPAPSGCREGDDAARIRCLLEARYASDPAARALALDLHLTTGGLAGLLPAQEIDGGYRGNIQLVPELPVGVHRKHLGWVRDAMREIDAFFVELGRSSGEPLRYRWREIDFRFFRSVGRTTPSAFTEGTWEVAYNVAGSLVSSGPAVRETLYHEIFHINDWAHGEWSKALEPIVSTIVARCGTRSTCLAPYTPTKMMVRSGTYYAFQPDNGSMTMEYAAELATRFFEEQSAAMGGRPRSEPAFKCGPVENGRAWQLLASEFFGGRDLVPACP